MGSSDSVSLKNPLAAGCAVATLKEAPPATALRTRPNWGFREILLDSLGENGFQWTGSAQKRLFAFLGQLGSNTTIPEP